MIEKLAAESVLSAYRSGHLLAELDTVEAAVGAGLARMGASPMAGVRNRAWHHVQQMAEVNGWTASKGAHGHPTRVMFQAATTGMTVELMVAHAVLTCFQMGQASVELGVVESLLAARLPGTAGLRNRAWRQMKRMAGVNYWLCVAGRRGQPTRVVF